MEQEGSTFLSGASGSSDYFFFAKERDDLVEADTPNASFFVYDKEDEGAAFRKSSENVGWPAISMATAKTKGDDRLVVAIGPNGDYWELWPATTSEVVGKISAFGGNLRRLSVVDGAFYACGMGRVVLIRQGAGRWKSIGPGELRGDPLVVGFEDIAGYSDAEMYAVGWAGEIWWRDEGRWRRADSPTSAILTSLCCTPEGIVFAVGHDGTMVRGRHDQWQLVETGRSENLKDVGSFEGEIFVVTDFEILKLGSAGLAGETGFADADDLPASCLHLLEASDGIVSLGTKDVFVKRAGPWRRLV